ncbi:universal stress protein [Aestuariivita sp.]|jgi:nucleotide-binding universal stress UspA family protein|uniref:universal stress protein n=1 Tax=Aestuariivita sp. TaxID=1872407 RepID=UPI002173F396|nr:universal stress protein [Aestuariivita sp.]MCE8005957.1 universal stress protein [Aestuariivita sp.]
MSLKTILVCMTTADHADTLMKMAVPLARRTGAHLIGLHTIEALLVYPGIAMHVPGSVFAQFNQNQNKEAAEIQAVFDKWTEAETFVSEWRLVKAEAVSAADRMLESARTADLVIMAAGDPQHDRVDQNNAQSRVIRDCGRPVIIVPLGYDGPEIGRSVVLGWSDTREAARAAHDLLLVTDPGAAVSVLRIDAAQSDPLTDYVGMDLAATYARQGLNASIVHRDKVGGSIAEAMNAHAFEQGADLIVTGAFGHSRAYDFVIGAATQDLLHHATYPVMFSK